MVVRRNCIILRYLLDYQGYIQQRSSFEAQQLECVPGSTGQPLVTCLLGRDTQIFLHRLGDVQQAHPILLHSPRSSSVLGRRRDHAVQLWQPGSISMQEAAVWQVLHGMCQAPQKAATTRRARQLRVPASCVSSL